MYNFNAFVAIVAAAGVFVCGYLGYYFGGLPGGGVVAASVLLVSTFYTALEQLD